MLPTIFIALIIAFVLAVVQRICLISFRERAKPNPDYLTFLDRKDESDEPEEEPEAYLFRDRDFIEGFNLKRQTLSEAVHAMEFFGVFAVYAASFLLLMLRFDDPFRIIAGIVVIESLVTISLVDWQFELIPDSLHLFILGAALLAMPTPGGPSFSQRLLGAAVGGGFLFVLMLLGGMGGGDVKLMAASGFYLGLTGVLLALFLGIIIAACVGVVLIAAGKKTRKDRIAFGPYLSMGIAAAMLFAPELLRLLF